MKTQKLQEIEGKHEQCKWQWWKGNEAITVKNGKEYFFRGNHFCHSVQLLGGLRSFEDQNDTVQGW